MARQVSTNFNYSGKIGKLVYVHSKAYKEHVRAAPGTYTEITLNDSLQESKNLLQICNQRLRPLFQALKQEHADGRLWSRLVAIFFQELKAGRKPNTLCFAGIECNLTNTLQELLPQGYQVDVKKEKKKLAVEVRLEAHPKVDDKLPRTGYQLRVIVLYPDFVKDTVRKEVVLGPVTKYDSALKTVKLEVPMPAAKTPYLVLLGVSPLVQEKPLTVQSDIGLRVVAVG